MPGESGVTVVTMLVCCFILHARLRAHPAPGIRRTLCFQTARKMARLAHARRDRAGLPAENNSASRRKTTIQGGVRVETAIGMSAASREFDVLAVRQAGKT